jgi:3',5'-cyclic-AMP phosphodiesterase
MKLMFVFVALLLSGWQGNAHNTAGIGNTHSATTAHREILPGLLSTAMHADDDTTLLRVAILGDAEPKPLAAFPNMAATVEQINALARIMPIDFVIGVGDIAHKGTEIQYEEATLVLRKLNAPFYPIMGNEEHGSTAERFLHYARKWNNRISGTRYILEYDQIAFVFASPDHGRDFDDSGAVWILDQIRRLAPKPVALVVHAAQKGVYSESPEKGVDNRVFREEIIAQPNLAVVISGDLHMDMDRVGHSKQIGHVHYLHIPALERTKIPDETNHTPMFRVLTVAKNGKVTIDTYAIGDTDPREEHAYSFTISARE